MAPGSAAFDFDGVVQRRGTASFKWDTYPQDVLPAFVADMDFVSPPAVVAALHERVEHGVFGYAVVPESMRRVVCTYLAERYGWQVEPQWLVFLPGVWAGLGLTVKAFSAPGEGVMMVTPIYPPFLEVVRAQGRTLQTVPAVRRDGRWELPLKDMEAAVTPQTRVLLFSSPHNPLGRAFDSDELAAVVDFCRRHDILFCSDEIHCDLILDPVAHVPTLSLAGARSTTIALMAPSKTYNVPGLQFAFAVIPDEELRRRFRVAADGLIELDMPGVCGSAAAEAAYGHGGPWLAALLEYLRGNAAIVERFVADELPGVTTTHVEATYLAWLDCRGLSGEAAAPSDAGRQGDVAAQGDAGARGDAAAQGDAGSPYRRCLAAGVALSDGAEFDAPGCLRLNFGCPRSTLHEVLRRTKVGLLGP